MAEEKKPAKAPAKPKAKPVAKTPVKKTAVAKTSNGNGKAHDVKPIEERVGEKAYEVTATARKKAEDLSAETRRRAEGYASEAQQRAGEFAVKAKSKTSEALTGLSRVIGDSAATIDDNVGSQYGDYVRSASRAVGSAAQTLDEKEVDELVEDTRAMVRQSPLVAIGIAAAAGFLLARTFRGSRRG